jgi:hypothetical protein
MTPTRRSLATTNSSNMGATNSTESNADQGQHLAVSNDQAQSPSKKESPNQAYQVRTQTQTQTPTQPPLKKPRPFSIPYPRLPSFTAATTEVLRRLTGTPPLPIPDSDNEKLSSPNAFIPASSPVPAQTPTSVRLPPPMISAAEAIKLRKEASSKKSPGTPPLPLSTTPTPAPAMSRKRSASKIEHGSSTPNRVSPAAQMFVNSIKTEPRYQPFPSELQSQPNSVIQVSTSTIAVPPSKPRLGRPPKNRDQSAVQTKTTQTPRGRKRKRSRNSDDESKDKVSDSDSGSEDYTPQTTVTKSGRQIQRPSAYQPPSAPEPSTASPKAPRQQTTKKTFRRKVGESSLCEHCLRGASPNNNQIVFCDGCNRAWHQHCHDPVIEVDVIREKDKEWFCGGCRKKNEPAPPKVQAPKPTSAPIPAPAPTFAPTPRPVEPPPLDMKGRIGGEAYTGPQVRTIFQLLVHSADTRILTSPSRRKRHTLLPSPTNISYPSFSMLAASTPPSRSSHQPSHRPTQPYLDLLRSPRFQTSQPPPSPPPPHQPTQRPYHQLLFRLLRLLPLPILPLQQ